MIDYRLVFFLFVAIVIGIAHLLGQYFKWALFCDPPEDMTFLAQNRMKRWFGPKGVKIYNYCLGAIFTVLGVASLLGYFVINTTG